MDFSSYSESQAFFEFSKEVSDPELGDFYSLKGRLRCLAALCEKALILPFALVFKIYKTFFRSVSLFFGAALLLATLGTSGGAREFFVRRFSILAKDLADWFLYPFAALSCMAKLLFAGLVHPAFYFRF